MTSSAHFWRVLWRFVKPEIEETIVYCLFIILFGALAFYQTFIKDASGRTQEVSEAFSLIEEKFAFITSGDDVAARIFTFGTWFMIGTVIYMIAWFLISFFSGAFHDIEVSNDYVHPRSFDKSNYWVSIGGRVVLRVAAAISLLIYSSIWIATLAPTWLASYREIFLSGIGVESTLNLLVALVGIVFSLHIGAILLRVILLRSKYFYQR
jgi:hypothetical protein